MALIKCPECQKEISDQAVSCPHCGFPLSKKDNKTKSEDMDFSSMEVILQRGLRKSIQNTVVILLVLAIAMAVAITVYFIETFNPYYLVSIPFIFICISFAIAMSWISMVKMNHNSNLKHECMYYDRNTNQFYIELWNFDIVVLDASEEIILKRNSWTFNENLVMYKGKRYNVGYSSTDLDVAKKRLKEIQK